MADNRRDRPSPATPSRQSGGGSTEAADQFPTRARAVANALRKDILSGALPAGTHLRQIEIATKMGVSTTPVREAFVALGREGIVRADSHKGVVVQSPTLADLDENYLIRIELEALATRQAVANLDEVALDDLAKLIERMRTATPLVSVELNREFHLRLYQEAGLPRLLEMIANLRDVSIAYLNMTFGEQVSQDDDVGQAEHVAIFEACKAGEAEEAARLMRLHLEDMRAIIVRHLEPGAGQQPVEPLPGAPGVTER